MNVRGPGDDVAGVDKLLGLSPELDARDRLQSSFAGRGTDCALQSRSPKAGEKSAVHGGAVQSTQGSAVGIRQNRFAAELGNDLAEALSDLVQSFIPRNALPGLCGDSCPFDKLRAGSRLSMRSEAPLRRPPFCRNPAHGIQHAVRRIHAVQVLRHFRTQKSACYRMPRIPLNLRGAATLYGDQHSASVGAVVRTRGMDHLLDRKSTR